MRAQATTRALHPGNPIAVANEAAVRVTSLGGRVWLTHERSTGDVLLEPGQWHDVPARAGMYLQGLGGQAEVRIELSPQAAAHGSLGRRLARAIAWLAPRRAPHY